MEPEIVVGRKFRLTNILIIGILIVVCAVLGYVYFGTRGPMTGAEAEPFVVPSDMTGAETVAKLERAGFVRNPWIFEIILHSSNPDTVIATGGYQLSKSMDAFEIAKILSAKSTSLWVTIPEGLRKEEIAEIMASRLGWDASNTRAFLNAYQTMGKNNNLDYFEGVYFPETYLVPLADSGTKVAKRMMSTFDEKLAKLAPILAKQNMKWTTMVKVASLVQREAANKTDMPVIAAIIWNRLEKPQRLEIDSTIQYAKNVFPDWWAPLSAGDTNFSSPYNTYRHDGLPPTPIANPGLDALSAAANPPVSKCLYYIHDADKVTHCATTFTEHKANIEKYLK